MIEDLERLLLSFTEVDPSNLESQLQWVEDAAIAATNAQPEIGEAGERAAIYLKAALGAFVAYTNSERTERDRLGLELSVRTLMTSALTILYGALSTSYAALAKSGPKKAQCRELSQLFSELERSTRHGKPPGRATLKRLAALQSRAAVRG